MKIQPVAVILLAAGLSAGCTKETTVSPPTWEKPPANGRFDYQIGGAYPPAAGVRIVDRDRGAATVTGLYSICYVNAFQTQPGENAWWERNHETLLLRTKDGYVEDPDWPGERLLDVSTPAQRSAAAKIVGEWFAQCAAKGFRAVEPDNLDSWTRSHGLLTRDDAAAYAKLLVAAAHTYGLAIAQKNTADLLGAPIGFDFAIVEECAVYDECGDFVDAYGNQVFEIEYTDSGADAYGKSCASIGSKISIVLRDRSVVPAGTAGYHYEWC
ncbi:endo alpha-1,4 polygalactosaminidase [Actinoplanes sp. CA-142083]|uniref:endo alpha-1,4 polygalactosaminidase n=1 Tax=Actinoplanes sp. CA-142083 TaxID=3239903 RepID=UPI003D90ADDC